jgi:hypothetical protein
MTLFHKPNSVVGLALQVLFFFFFACGYKNGICTAECIWARCLAIKPVIFFLVEFAFLKLGVVFDL